MMEIALKCSECGNALEATVATIQSSSGQEIKIEVKPCGDCCCDYREE